LQQTEESTAESRPGSELMLIGWSVLLIVHGMLAVFLLGALTHQVLAVAWPVTRRDSSFMSAVRSVDGQRYTNAVIILFILTFALGTIIYPTYRLNVRIVLQEYRFLKPEGSFELKEHFLAISLALLPAYWYFWRKANEENRVTRTMLTTILAFSVWWGFLTGHVINNIRGFGS
jgi:hypothetical protein